MVAQMVRGGAPQHEQRLAVLAINRYRRRYPKQYRVFLQWLCTRFPRHSQLPVPRLLILELRYEKVLYCSADSAFGSPWFQIFRRQVLAEGGHYVTSSDVNGVDGTGVVDSALESCKMAAAFLL